MGRDSTLYIQRILQNIAVNDFRRSEVEVSSPSSSHSTETTHRCNGEPSAWGRYRD